MITKHKAKYQDGPRGSQHCALCSMYRAGGRCTLVEGKISPQGWCIHYERKKEED